MEKSLIILNQQPIIPPFMLAAITAARDYYECIYYINTKEPNNIDAVDKESNIEFIYPTRFESVSALLKSLFTLFYPIVFKDLIKCFRAKGVKFKILRLFLIEQSVHNRLYPLSRRIIKRHGEESCLTVLSTWFDACAYTAATIKKKCPLLKAVSLAHSYEILPIRNPYVPYRHIEFKHKFLDGVFFISHKVREMYLEGITPLPQNLLEKTHVCYLGTYRNDLSLSQVNDDSVFCICSCSRVVDIKRLDVLLDALKKWNYGKIRWVHIGDGPLFDFLKAETEKVMVNNQDVEIRFIGRLANEEVKRYYANHSIDLFINISSIEGLPISIMEAISYGIPVVATDVGGTNEIVKPEIGFLLGKDPTSDEICQALWSYFKMSVEDKKMLRANAFAFWNSNFNAKINLRLLFDKIENGIG